METEPLFSVAHKNSYFSLHAYNQIISQHYTRKFTYTHTKISIYINTLIKLELELKLLFTFSGNEWFHTRCRRNTMLFLLRKKNQQENTFFSFVHFFFFSHSLSLRFVGARIIFYTVYIHSFLLFFCRCTFSLLFFFYFIFYILIRCSSLFYTIWTNVM